MVLQAQAAEGVASDQAESKVAGTEMADTSLADNKQQVKYSCLRKYVLKILVALGTGTTVALDTYCSAEMMQVNGISAVHFALARNAFNQVDGTDSVCNTALYCDASFTGLQRAVLHSNLQ